jgi:hypothetical protein
MDGSDVCAVPAAIMAHCDHFSRTAHPHKRSARTFAGDRHVRSEGCVEEAGRVAAPLTCKVLRFPRCGASRCRSRRPHHASNDAAKREPAALRRAQSACEEAAGPGQGRRRANACGHLRSARRALGDYFTALS